ncbi:MAG TPA: peptidylprolyl isomerase [Usitatibacter sp.]|nr:peptidylprolyl isomerase [Usitatibacter sp.]
MRFAIAIAGALLAGTACAATPDPKAVILENGTQKITVEDFDAAMTRFPENLRDTARASGETILKLIDALFVNRVLAQRARDAGLDRDPVVQKRIEQLVEGFLAGKYLETLDKRTVVPDLEARAFELYTADPKKYLEPATASVSHIVVSLVGRTPEQARERVLEARAKLEAGEPLEAVARAYSDDRTPRPAAGQLGTVKRSDLEEPLADAAFSMESGKWSAPISTRTGMHIVRVADRKAERQLPFKDAKAAIVEEQADKFRKAAIEKEINAVRNNPANVIDRDRVEALKSRIDPALLDKAQRDAVDKIQTQQR